MHRAVKVGIAIPIFPGLENPVRPTRPAGRFDFSEAQYIWLIASIYDEPGPSDRGKGSKPNKLPLIAAEESNPQQLKSPDLTRSRR